MSKQTNLSEINGASRATFFWEKLGRAKGRSRFNLLLLEYGEYFFEDLSVYSFPVPNDIAGRSFRQCDALKVQGRLKICSRSILFEPNDLRKPIIRFPFKYFLSEPEPYRLASSESAICSVNFSGLFTFLCSVVFEMKSENVIGPYQQLDYTTRPEGPQVLFALVHSDPKSLLTKLASLRKVFHLALKEGWRTAENELITFLTQSSGTFDSSKLVQRKNILIAILI